MVAPIYTWKPVPPEAPSCATCKHFRLEKGFPIFGTDKTLCRHPKAVHKITGAAADAYMVRMAASQTECNVEGLWWETAEFVPPAVMRSTRSVSVSSGETSYESSRSDRIGSNPPPIHKRPEPPPAPPPIKP